mmetsp:Transcript_3427/g.7496  ORF Transcript_3427/g.7496 Transcript_3427/m.7496 type:complete len:85 (+) Transcript_3427:65-319(+)
MDAVAVTTHADQAVTTRTSTTTPRDPNTLHNFGPASRRDFCPVHFRTTPGGDPPSEDAIIPAATVAEWVDFYESKGHHRRPGAA